MAELQLKNWDLPECVLKQYSENGLVSMFQWQADCLFIDGVLSGRNLVYAAPTSAGKTLVVEILMLKRVLETGKKALFILPFISVAREKLFHLRRLFEETGIRVDGYMGGHAPTNGFTSVDIAVCTIEKANGLINRLIEERDIDKIGLLVVDELHMVGDEGRGYILELLLTKIQFMGKQNPQNKGTSTNIQIVGMSATLPNLELLADWLNAALFITDFRPVPLQRCLKIGATILNSDLVKVREFTPAFNSKNDEDNIAALCYETLSEGNSVLVFCPTKNWCEKLANNIAHQFYDLNCAQQKDASFPFVRLNLDQWKDIFEQLCHCPVGVDTILNRTIPLGVAYHHAGLTTEERDIVENGFRIGAIRVLVATSTLSSGVNLPARRVIIRTPTFNRKTLDVRTYLQMTGRAGRKGVDDQGESILICRTNEQSRGKNLLTAQPRPIKSCLIQANNEELTSSMKRAILEIIVNGIASTYAAVKSYTDCTLLSSQIRTQDPPKENGPVTRRRSSLSPSSPRNDKGVSYDVIEACIQWLVEHEFVHIQTEENLNVKEDHQRHIIATQLGRAALLSSLPTSEALTVLADLNQAMKALALDTELHLIYLVTPIFCYNEWTGLDWFQYLNVYESLPTSYKNAASLIGVDEQFLTRMASGASATFSRKGKQAEKMQRLLGTHRRFYAALALHDLVQEMPLPTVCEKYSCNRGMLQQLQQSAASFAGMVTTFCQELGWWSLEVLLREFQTRLAFGVQRELMDLMQISILNSQRARALYSAGLISCKLLANSNPTSIEVILRNSAQFKTTRKTVNEAEWEVEERKKQKNIHITGRKGMTEHEAALFMIEEARKICGRCDSLFQVTKSCPSENENSTLCESDEKEEIVKEIKLDCILNEHKNENNAPTQEIKHPLNEDNFDIESNLSCNNEILNPILNTTEESNTVTPVLPISPSSTDSCLASNQLKLDLSSCSECSLSKNVTEEQKIEDKENTDHCNLKVSEESSQESPIQLVFEGSSLDELFSDEEKSPESNEVPTFSVKSKSFHKISQARNSLTDSQLNGLLCDSFSEDLLAGKDFHTPSRAKIKTDEDSLVSKTCNKTPLSLIKSPENDLSPATLKAMDLSFSPCLFGNDTPDRVQDLTNLASAKNIPNTFLELKKISTPLCNNTKTPAVQYMLQRNDGQSPFLSAGQVAQSCCKNYCEENTNQIYKEENDSLDDLFNPGESCETEPFHSTGELDCALNLSKMSSSFGENSSSFSVEKLEVTSGAENLDTRKRKSPNHNDVSKHFKTGDEVTHGTLCTPAKSIVNEDIQDQIILSSQKEKPHKKRGKKKRMKSSRRITVTSPNMNSDFIETEKNSQSHLKVISTSDHQQFDASSPDRIQSQLESQTVTASQSGLTIIDVCSHASLFDSFLKEFQEKKYFAFAVAVERIDKTNEAKFGMMSENSCQDQTVVGISLCWGQQDAYYVSFENAFDSVSPAYHDNEVFSILKPPALCKDLSSKQRIDRLKTLAEDFRRNNCVALAIDIKKQFKALLKHTEINFSAHWQDPTIAAWMLDPTGKEKTLIGLVNHFIPEDLHLLTGLEMCCSTYGSISCSARNSGLAPARIRACAEAVCCYRLMKRMKKELTDVKIWKTFCTIEMPHVMCLAHLEMNGIGFDFKECSNQISRLHEIMRHLEKQAYKLAKRQFAIGSPSEVAKVLFGELGLTENGDEKNILISNDFSAISKSATSWRRGKKKGGKIGKSWSTKKEVLEKLRHLHPLPGIVLSWRQINNTLNKGGPVSSCAIPLRLQICVRLSSVKMGLRRSESVKRVVHPFSRICKKCPHSKIHRVHSECIVQSVTGRVSVTEPNIQNVPKPFQVEIIKRSNAETEVQEVCIRNLFIPDKDHVLLAADYSQLELRIFAHLSGDDKLLAILNRKRGDVFKMIAAQWKGVAVEAVTDQERQRAKQICYGMLYGIGPRALSEQLSVDEKSAEEFMESFMRSYPTVRSYIHTLVEQCKEKGYVETLLGRRRYLPSIRDSDMSVRAQTERQAVNTTIQGSAADLVKKATVKIMDRLQAMGFSLLPESQRNVRGRSMKSFGCYFVLHLHDEIMFEVNSGAVSEVTQVVRSAMEEVMKLTVRLPVKLSMGDAWGRLKDCELGCSI